MVLQVQLERPHNSYLSELSFLYSLFPGVAVVLVLSARAQCLMFVMPWVGYRRAGHPMRI